MKNSEKSIKHTSETLLDNQPTLKNKQLSKSLLEKMAAKSIFILVAGSFILLMLGGGMFYTNYLQGKNDVAKRMSSFVKKNLNFLKKN